MARMQEHGFDGGFAWLIPPGSVTRVSHCFMVPRMAPTTGTGVPQKSPVTDWPGLGTPASVGGASLGELRAATTQLSLSSKGWGLVHERRSGSKDAPAPPSPNPLRCAGAMQSSSDTVLQRGAQREQELQFYFLSLTHISHLFYSMHNLLVPEHMDITDKTDPSRRSTLRILRMEVLDQKDQRACTPYLGLHLVRKGMTGFNHPEVLYFHEDTG